ncbi:hypothetical protein [Streptomyces sp. NBC_01565]|uniref:hypothetical protein n=1 Tax=Streptomyces sp. NBC_01565 TaxID=2975881 RepID=UPI00224EF441|nr:hypothetical protein [Streptomyces sp. NBC_01565]MCX4543825.1 hypothetical protein [Streptomyces sp. NBC_01565]
MSTVAAIRELLLAGQSESAIARRLNVGIRRIKRIRLELGLPPHKSGPTPSGSHEDKFWRRAQPTSDGHLLWPGATPTIRAGDGSEKSTAPRVAFRIRHRREPVGKVMPDCGVDHCVHPDHVSDQPMRDTFRAIFGTAA